MQIPGFQIIRQIGKGGMATVYLAIQESLDREVAIKVMSPFLAEDETFGERFVREAKIVAKLSHPNIIAVYDVGAVDGQFYIAMQYSPGGDLKQKIATGLNEQQAVIITQQIASALQYAHDKGFIHRDVKPANVLFDQHGNACLTDFGVAKATSAATTSLTVAGSVIGTPTYMSPEQARGDTINHCSDLYSLGVVFYEMLSGQPPYQGDSGVSIAIKHISSPIPELPSAFARYQSFINRLLSKNSLERFQSGNEIIQELNNIYQYSTDAVTQIMQKVAPMAQPTGPQSGVVQAAISQPISTQQAAATTPPPFQPKTQPITPSPPALSTAPVIVKKTNWAIPISLLFVVIAIAAYLIFEPDIKIAIQTDDTLSGKIKPDETIPDQTQPDQTQLVQTKPDKTKIGEATTAPTTLTKPTDAVIESTQPIAAEKPTIDSKQAKIVELLRIADQAYENNNYVFPENQSALSGYRQVLVIDPDNSSAHSGIHRIGDHYLKYAHEAAQKNNLFLAQQHLVQAQAIVPDDPKIAVVKAEIEQAKQQEADNLRQREQQRLELAQRSSRSSKSDKLTKVPKASEPAVKKPVPKARAEASVDSVKTAKPKPTPPSKSKLEKPSPPSAQQSTQASARPPAQSSSVQSSSAQQSRQKSAATPTPQSTKTTTTSTYTEPQPKQLASSKPEPQPEPKPLRDEKPAETAKPSQPIEVATIEAQKDNTAATEAERLAKLEKQIKDLSQKGYALLSKKDLTLEEIEQAHKYYKEIDALSPNHNLAKKGYNSTVRACVLLANAEYRRKDYNDARKTVDKGLSLDRKNSQLLSLQRRLRKAPKTNRADRQERKTPERRSFGGF